MLRGRRLKNRLRVLIVSTCSLPTRLPSDKQFINDLIEYLPSNIAPALWTMNEAIPQNTNVFYGKKNILYTSVNRFGHKPWCTGDNGLVLHHHNEIRHLSETVITLLIASFRSLRKSINKHNAQILHFADDIGPAIPIVKRIFPFLKITCAKPSTRTVVGPANSPYGIRLRVGLSYADIVIAFTETCRKNLLKLGLKNSIEVIPWSIVQPEPVHPERIKRIRSELGCSPEHVLVIGSPRNLSENLEKAIKVAESVSKRTLLRFVFCIKPTLYNKDYPNLSSQRVIVLKSPPHFYEMLEAADALFAPQGRITHTSLPFLVWLEAMIRGAPVVTEDCPGVTETIENEVSGLLYDGYESAPSALEKLCDADLIHSMKKNARRVASTKYNISNAVNKYAAIWLSLVSKESSFLSRPNNESIGGFR